MAGRPKQKILSWVQLGLRASRSQAELLQRAAELDAQQRGAALVSRNNFCLRAALDAAKQIVAAAGESVPE